MTTIPPSLPQVPATVPATPAAVTATVVSQPPAPIANLILNSVIDATVTALPTRGLAQLQTSAGPLLIRLPIALPPNANVSLQLTSLSPSLQFRLLSINGNPTLPGLLANIPDPLPTALPDLPDLAPATPNPANSRSAQGPADTVASSATLPSSETAANGIAATVVYGADPALPPGTALTLRIVNMQLPAAGGGPIALPRDTRSFPPAEANLPPRTLRPPGPAVARDPGEALPLAADEPGPDGGIEPASPAGGAQSAVAATPPADKSSPAASPLANTQSPPSPAAAGPAPPQLANPTQPPAGMGNLTGVVAPNSLAGMPLVQTDAGLLSLNGGPDLPPGTRLELAQAGPPVLPEPQAVAGAQPTPAPPSGGQPWAAVNDAVATLQKTDPAAAQMMLSRLPDLGPQFMPATIAWISAAQSGDVRSWLGENTVKALEKAGRKDLVDRLGSGLGEMKSAVSLPTGGEWQSLTLPLFFGQHIERIRLTVRKPPEDDEEAAGRDEEGLRFLVDLDMSRLGAMQIDGLVKRRAKRFDLIIRSRLALADDVRRDIGSIFNRALEGLGMTGSAAFKQTAAFIEPIPIRPHAGLTI